MIGLRRRQFVRVLGFIAGLVLLYTQSLPARGAEAVHFQSGDGRTDLIGYLFQPSGPGPHAAVVMMHGRGGPYSSLAKGVYNADTLSMRHRFWGELWASKGYVALLVDSFGSRGYWRGFPKASYDDRPSEVSEQTVRPLDAYGALSYLRKRPDVIRDRIGLQGWSNGAMTALATMSSRAPGISNPTPASGFRAALAFYPGCGMEAIQGSYKPYATIEMFVGTADAEVSPTRCITWEKRVQSAGGSIELTAYEGAEHDFDDPGASRQRNAANAAATRDAVLRAEEFFAQRLK
jgi:dienelactone hydrolase